MFIDPVVAVGNRTELIGRRGRDRPHQLLHIESARDKTLRDGIQQLGVRRRIGLAHIVLGINQAAVEEVLPVAIHERVREERIVLLPQPVGQREARIVVRGQFHRRVAQTRGLHREPVLLIALRRDRALRIDDFLARLRTRFARHLREERAEAVVIVLAPLLIRMMMALRALQPQTEEQLRRVLHLRVGRLHLTIPSHRRIFRDVTRRREHFADELIIRLVAHEAVANPRVERIRAAHIRLGLAIHVAALIPQQRTPHVREIIRVITTRQQRVNPLVPLGRIFVRKKFFRLFRRRHAPRDIQRHAANKRRVIANFRRRHPNLLEFREHLFVDEIFRHRQMIHRRAQRNRRAEHRDLRLIANHHAQLARLLREPHQPRALGAGHVLVVRLVQHRARHVLDCPVRVVREHHQLLLGARRHHALFRKHLDAHHSRVIRAAIRHPLRHPAANQVVIISVHLQPPTATMRHHRRALHEQQALVRSRREQPAPPRFLHEMFVILRRLKPEQRKFEAILPARLAVATAAIAARLRENRHDLVRKINRRHMAELLHRHRGRGCQSLRALRRHRRLPVAFWNNVAILGHLNHARGLGLVTHRPRKIPHRARRKTRRHQNLLPRVAAL